MFGPLEAGPNQARGSSGNRGHPLWSVEEWFAFFQGPTQTWLCGLAPFLRRPSSTAPLDALIRIQWRL